MWKGPVRGSPIKHKASMYMFPEPQGFTLAREYDTILTLTETNSKLSIQVQLAYTV